MSDHFDVFGLPRRFALDADGLRRHFYELSRRHHPDFHQLAGADERASALASSAEINRAYRTLRDPLARVEYLVALDEGAGTPAPAAKPKPPMELLEEMMDVQETLEEAKRAGLDDAARARLSAERQRLVDRRAATEAEIAARGADWDAAVDAGRDRGPLRRWFREAFAARAYLRTVIDDLTDAMGDPDAHVSHRRH